MVRKLQMDALRADMSTVEALLAARTAEDDPIGHLQFTKRLAELQQSLESLGDQPALKGSIALFFGGEPVIGSRGVRADFAGRALEQFQDLVAKQFAIDEIGQFGTRGPVPLRAHSSMLLTDLARGSVGLVLAETDQNDVIAETALSVVLDEVTGVLERTAAADAEGFERVLEEIDARYLRSLAQFFSHLDEQNATLRLVEGLKEVSFAQDDIRRARARAEAAQIEEQDEFVDGTLYLLPAHRKFELELEGDQGTIWGGIASEFARRLLEQLAQADSVVGKKWRVRVRVRTVQRPNAEPKLAYTLLGLIESLDQQ